MIDDNEVRRKFQQFGDVKSVMPVGDRTEYVILVTSLTSLVAHVHFSQRYVEYYDMRVRCQAMSLLFSSRQVRIVTKPSIGCVTRACRMVPWT